MGKPAKSGAQVRDWPGMLPDADPRDIPPGAAEEQVNVQSATPGELSVRPGYRVVTFEEE